MVYKIFIYKAILALAGFLTALFLAHTARASFDEVVKEETINKIEQSTSCFGLKQLHTFAYNMSANAMASYMKCIMPVDEDIKIDSLVCEIISNDYVYWDTVHLVTDDVLLKHCLPSSNGPWGTWNQ